jgi:glutamyl-tRNA synthetase
VVDDHLMGITHVIRGEEWLPSAPLHVLLYQSLGWADTMPQFAHLPLLLKPEGNGKLSKRDALIGGFPIFPMNWQSEGETVTGFKEAGYLPDALVNFLAFLGWNPGTDQELFSLNELIEAFDINKIHKGGARFDISKANWFNQQYIKNKSDDDLVHVLAETSPIGRESLKKMVLLMKDRVTFPHEIIAETTFLFNEPSAYDQETVASKWNDDAKLAMPIIANALASVDVFNAENIHNAIFTDLQAAGIKPGKVMAALRLVITGLGKGPDLMLSMEIIGKNSCQSRINYALKTLN